MLLGMSLLQIATHLLCSQGPSSVSACLVSTTNACAVRLKVRQCMLCKTRHHLDVNLKALGLCVCQMPRLGTFTKSILTVCVRCFVQKKHKNLSPGVCCSDPLSSCIRCMCMIHTQCAWSHSHWQRNSVHVCKQPSTVQRVLHSMLSTARIFKSIIALKSKRASFVQIK